MSYDEIDLKPVDSSNIDSVGYNEDLEVLVIQFCRGGRYAYGGVPSEVYAQLLNAPSIGRFFAKNINKSEQYECIKLT